MTTTTPGNRIGYVLKMYPRFSETFIVSEILAREAAGEELVIFSLRPPVDPRFHPELARVQAPVIYLDRPSQARRWWDAWQQLSAHPDLATGAAAALPELLAVSHDDAGQAVALAQLARKLGVRHLHAHFASVATTVARLAAKITDLPYSFTAHAKDIFHDDVDPRDLYRKLSEAHHAVTISDYNLNHLQAAFGEAACDRLHVVRNGLELARFEFRDRGPIHGAPRMLSVGRLVEKKGFDMAIEAIALLQARGIACSLDIVGDGPEHDRLAELIEVHDLTGSVRLLGPCTQAEVQQLLTEHDLFLAPFVVAEDGNADGLPTVLLEAMACGIPCVAADVTAVGEAVVNGATGWLVPAGDLSALVAATVDALSSPGERQRRARAARQRVVARHDHRLQADQLRRLVTTDAVGSPQIAAEDEVAAA